MADEEKWSGQYTRRQPADGWEQLDFNTKDWASGRAAFGTDMRRPIGTYWDEENSDLYVRRTFDLTAADIKKELVLKYSHDDGMELYINGTRVVNTGNKRAHGEMLILNNENKALLHVGKNVIASHCHNQTGRAYTDFGLYAQSVRPFGGVITAKQKNVDVLATNTYYNFTCGPIDLDLVFTAPMLINDYDLLSTPINYISYQVHATDGRNHRVELYLATTQEMGQDNVDKGLVPSTVTLVNHNGVNYAKSGTVKQPILARKGDGVCIDWGYVYLSDDNGRIGLAPYLKSVGHFISNGKLTHQSDSIVAKDASELMALAYIHDFEPVGSQTQSAYTMIGYDEIEDIEYLYHRYKAYWAHEGKVTIFDAFNKLRTQYKEIMAKCQQQDKVIYDDGMKSGGVKYAEILSGSYRHVIAAHKLFKDNEGNLLFFSKENNSNGSVNTVDLTYPSAPLFLIYNPELEKAMMTSIFNYSKSGRWNKPFTAHDMGTYPIANGQTYGGDMPLEECGNMLILAAQLCMLDGNTQYVDKYWKIIKQWADYLVDNGQDPSDQLCTDDFAGHWAHNCNLSAKAIMGIMGYAKMARMKGLVQEAKQYEDQAHKMGIQWEKDAKDGDHYRLAFDRPDTWSQKYNMVWDKLWKTNIFPNNAIQTEVKYYLTKQNKFGLPLDCRKDYTKSDWIMWSAAMAKNQKDFEAFVNPLYTYINETDSRVPICDWHDTKTGLKQAMIARSVIGGYWMRVFADKMEKTRK